MSDSVVVKKLAAREASRIVGGAPLYYNKYRSQEDCRAMNLQNPNACYYDGKVGAWIVDTTK